MSQGSQQAERNVVLAMTGASGAIYALRLLEILLEAGRHVHLTVSTSARLVVRQELGIDVALDKFDPRQLVLSADSPHRHGMPAAISEVLSGAAAASLARGRRLTYHHVDDLFAPIASGSFLTDAMVICPCSGSTLGAVVHGTGENLIHRAAGVHLKERRKLIVVPRETPLSTIQLENMRRAAEAGAVVLPAMPGFYHGAQSIRDLVDFVVARICDQLGMDNALMRRWGS
jgi:flavin prenyltransferase